MSKCHYCNKETYIKNISNSTGLNLCRNHYYSFLEKYKKYVIKLDNIPLAIKSAINEIDEKMNNKINVFSVLDLLNIHSFRNENEKILFNNKILIVAEILGLHEIDHEDPDIQTSFKNAVSWFILTMRKAYDNDNTENFNKLKDKWFEACDYVDGVLGD